jgi:formylmethanofuran dehydrogenase subunit E
MIEQAESKTQPIGEYTLDEFINLAESFHGYAAPGVIIGGVMVDLAMQRMPKGILYDALSETTYCLPDAIQILTPCTTGNGWMKVLNLGRYAVSLYDKYTGEGIRVFIDSLRIQKYPELYAWFYKTRPKKEQDSRLILHQIREAGPEYCQVEAIQVQPAFLKKRHKDKIATCPLCREAYPENHGLICRACQGQSPYRVPVDSPETPALQTVPVESSVGRRVLHDMTEIIPGIAKGAVFRKGDIIGAGDLCRLQRMGKNQVYVEPESGPDSPWVHENEAALSFARAMAGPGVSFKEPPMEGKISFFATRSGLLVVDDRRLEAFNQIPGVMAASRTSFTVLDDDRSFAGTRAIPLYLPRRDYIRAMSILAGSPLFQVLPLQPMDVGVLVTGTEVYLGLVEDRFIPIIRAKTEKYGSKLTKSAIVPDQKEAIVQGIRTILDSGVNLLVTTAGLSVDPDDVTRQALIEAGAEDILYGAPILPGAMTLLARIQSVPVIGVPACALFFPTTSFDLLLPRLLAGIPITREDIARMGHGAFCLECKTCSYPKCPFGK